MSLNVITLFTILLLIASAIIGFLLMQVRKENKRTQSLEQNETRYRQILNAIPDMILLKGPHSKLIWANRSFCEYYGMSNEQLQGIIDAPFNTPDNTQQYIRDDALVFNTGQPLEAHEPVIRSDGVTRFFHTIKAPIFDERHQVIQTVGISRDITTQKETSELLEQQRAKMIASSKMSALGEMAGNIAHEINNPLAIISVRAGQLKELASEKNADQTFILKTAEIIELTTLRISKIIKSLRTFSRDGTKDPFQKNSLRALIQETIEICIQQYRTAKIELRIVLPDEQLTIECQSIQISQVLLNLLNNAYDAVQSHNEKWVKVEVHATDEKASIWVTDSGPRIPNEIIPKIMTPFFTTKASGKGIGIGLNISKGIVEAHHGRLFIDRNTDHTRFVIELPLRQPDHSSNRSNASTGRPSGNAVE